MHPLIHLIPAAICAAWTLFFAVTLYADMDDGIASATDVAKSAGMALAGMVAAAISLGAALQ